MAGRIRGVRLVILLTIAQLADLATEIIPRPRGWVSVEYNPLASALLTQPAIAVAAKFALLALVVSTTVIVGRTNPRLATGVVVVGIVAGCFGVASNSRLISWQ